MLKRYILMVLWARLCLALFVEDVPLFHENSKTVFRPTSVGTYFGYSVLLKKWSPFELLVGAPKAPMAAAKGRPGALHRCPLVFGDASTNVSCAPHFFPPNKRSHTYAANPNYFEDDMWLGASLTDVTEDTLLICAPRWMAEYTTRYQLIEGLCYILPKDNTGEILLLSDDSSRNEYKITKTPIYSFDSAQLGMSVKMSENLNSLLIGAPGLWKGSGAIVEYRLTDRKWTGKHHRAQSISGEEIESNYYMGYSVDTGVFEPSGETLFVAGAPRGAAGRGHVLIFKPSETRSMLPTVKGRLEGPHLGAYFGASLLCADLNADGLADVLVGAPNYVSEHKFSYDQGAVYVYLTEPKKSGFDFRAAGLVQGSGASSARFGSAIALLNDVNGDGYPEVAVGAPWEEGGRGAVYVYSAHARGLHTAHAQRISPSGARGFGIAISKGLDIDSNDCNDLAVGAYASDETYLFRCVPTITLKTSIIVPGIAELPQNTTNFTASFCIQVDPAPLWPRLRLELKASISVDKQGNRAYLDGASDYIIQATPGSQSCEKKIVTIKEGADLSRPIYLYFDAIPLRGNPTLFSSHKARLSNSFGTHASILIQLTDDCGEDQVCQPELIVQLQYLESSRYIPGSGARAGVIATVVNAGEPAYGAVVNFSLPAAPKRVPGSCEMFASNMTCKVPSPLLRGENASYVVELAYVQKGVKEDLLNVTAEIYQQLNRANKTQILQNLVIKVLPTANIIIKGKVLPNATLHVTREQFSAGGLIKFAHYFEIANLGPSDWPYLDAELKLANWISLSGDIESCARVERQLTCSFDIPAHVSSAVELPLAFDLKEHGDKLEENGIYEATTVLMLKQYSMNSSLTTRFVLMSAPPVWPLVVGVIVGLLLLAAILYALHKCGFFTRKRPQDLQETEQIIQEGTSQANPAGNLRKSVEDADQPSHPPSDGESD